MNQKICFDSLFNFLSFLQVLLIFKKALTLDCCEDTRLEYRSAAEVSWPNLVWRSVLFDLQKRKNQMYLKIKYAANF